MYSDEQTVKILLEEFSKTRTTVSYRKFYKPKLEKFFYEFLDRPENCKKPIHSIGSYEVNQFLNTLAEHSMRKLNYYYAIDAFFSFTYSDGKTIDVMKDVLKPLVLKKPLKYIPDDHVQKIKNFINNSNNKFMDRFLLAFMLYTGLSREYLSTLFNYQLYRDEIDEKFYLGINIGDEQCKLPLNCKLQLLIDTYKKHDGAGNIYNRVFDYHETYMSSKVATLSKQITGVSYSPQVFSNTFIKLALNVSFDVYAVSKLTLKSLSAIEKHITTNDKIIDIQQNIVDKI